MKKALLASALTAISLVVTGCNIKSLNKKDKYTIMVYMCGADLESGFDGYSTNASAAGLGSKDIFEMCSASDKPKDVNIIIETGGAKAWKNSKIDKNKLQRWHIEDGALVKDQDLQRESMGESSTFQSFLEWGLKKYPAEKTGVILWNHGGAMQGVCYDENYNDDSLLASEVSEALAGAFKNAGRKEKLEWIGYDACLMQVQDIAEANSDYFNYMVGSQESEAGEGWDYDRWLDNLYRGESTEQILTEICDTFVEFYDNHYGKSSNDQTLSFLDLSKMSEYKTAWDNLSTKISSTIGSSKKKGFQNMMKTIKNYGTTYYSYYDLINAGLSTSPSSQYYYGNFGIVQEGSDYVDYGYNSFGIFDVKDFLNKLGSSYEGFTSEISSVQAAYEKLVVYSKIGKVAGESNGLCLYFPMHDRCHSSDYYSAKETRLTSWKAVTETLGVNK